MKQPSEKPNAIPYVTANGYHRPILWSSDPNGMPNFPIKNRGTGPYNLIDIMRVSVASIVTSWILLDL